MPETQGGLIKYTREDLDLFVEGTDYWEGLANGLEITEDPNGLLIDVWDPATKKVYASVLAYLWHGLSTGTRETSYEMPPDIKELEDMSQDELKVAGRDLLSDMSEESRSINTQRRSFYDKNKRYKALKREYKSRTELAYRRRYYIPKRYPVYTGVYRTTTTEGNSQGFFAT